MEIFRVVIQLYIWVIIIDSFLSFLPQYRHQTWAVKVRELAEFGLAPIRQVMPKGMMIDFSPMILIILLNILMSLF
jgi:uncharacterized protein YggT (Ycf19 family)